MVARRRVSRGTRRKLVWARHAEEQFTVPTATFNALNLLGTFETAYGANLIGCTVVRIRLRWSAFIADTTGQPVAGLGVRVADEADITTSAPADPLGPLSDLHADWMAWDTTLMTVLQGGTTNPSLAGPLASRYLDVKAMRKFDELGQGVYAVFEHTAAVNVVYNVSTSVLVALP